MENTQPISFKQQASKVDEVIILQARNGAKEALAEIYDVYLADVYRYIFSRVGNRADAEDITTQTFMSIAESLPAYRNVGKFSAWVFQIAKNKVNDHFRKQKITSVELPIDFPSPINVSEQIATKESYEKLAVLIKSLNTEERELLQMRYVAQLPLVEIGAVMNRSADAVRKALTRLLGKLAKQMEVEND